MTTVVHSQPPAIPNPYARRHRQSGILLSPFPSHSSPYTSSASASSASSASSSTSSHTSLTNTPPSSAPSSRRIRFAPLPDPRRAVYITDDGDELPLLEEATQLPCPPTPSSRDSDNAAFDTSSLSSASSASNRNSYAADSVSSTPGTMTPISTTPEENTSALASSPTSSPFLPASPLPQYAMKSAASMSKSGSSFSKSLLFRPFKTKASTSSAASSHSLTPTPSLDPAPQGGAQKGNGFARRNFSTEEILTLGTINLFRTSSRDSRLSTKSNENESSSGWNLQRWTSGGVKDTTPSWGAPLTRSQSSQSGKGKSNRRSSFLSLPSPLSNTNKATKAKFKPASPVAATTPTARKGTRMLNGRIYGGPRRPHSAGNPFANARDETDPEFVEWGYGGMGSVRSRSGVGNSGVWGRLQSDGHGVVMNSPRDEDDDDGSGMGWVRRRREERERQKRDEEEKAKRAKEAARVDDVCTEESKHPEIDVKPAPLPSPPTTQPAEQDHVLSAVTLPAHLHRHHHHHRARVPSRSSTVDSLSTLQSIGDLNERTLFPDSAAERDDDGSGSESESGSESGSAENKGDNEESDYDDDEEDEEEHDNKRKIVSSAGVEKVSRHKERDSDGASLHASQHDDIPEQCSAGGGGTR